MADGKTLALVGGVLVLLAAATGVGQFLKLYPDSGLNPPAVRSFNLAVAGLVADVQRVGRGAVDRQHGDGRAVRRYSFWRPARIHHAHADSAGRSSGAVLGFFLFTPLQYLLIGMMGDSHDELYNVLIPVYAFLFILARVAVSGDYKRFLERTAKIQAGLLICVYCLSFAPALLFLDLQARRIRKGPTSGLLFFFILMVQLSDALHFLWSRLVGRHVIAPTISPSKTWEGFLGGTASATLLARPCGGRRRFQPWGAAGISLLISIMGFAGGMTMSAIKRDRGVKDYGTLVEGHGGVLDRIDSLCFAAPVFFHITRSYFP